MILWLTILAAGLLTFGIRLSFILLLERANMPPWFERALRFVPITVLSAIILPEAAAPNGAADFSPLNPQMAAAFLAGLVAMRAKSVVWSIAAGMAALLALQALF